jgi:hypothetical protein
VSLEVFQLSRIEILVENTSQIRRMAATIGALLDRYHEQKTFSITTSLDD